MLLKLDEITLIEGNHAREKINHKQVSQYASLMKDGVIFPPVIVFGEENILGDGWHRFFAHRLNKKTEIMAEKKDGGAREARLYSYQANNHGLPPTQKERIVNAQYLLDDPEWSSWSDAKIAVHVGLGRTTVWRMRKTVSKKQNKEIPQKTPKESVKEPVKEFVTETPEENTFQKPSESDMAALDDSQVQELADTITELQKEILSLRDIIASKRWDATDMEQEDILDTVKELRTQIEILEEDNKTLRISRDTHQQRCAELIRINKSLQHRAKKAA
jgi:hypothetical protein